MKIGKINNNYWIYSIFIYFFLVNIFDFVCNFLKKKKKNRSFFEDKMSMVFILDMDCMWLFYLLLVFFMLVVIVLIISIIIENYDIEKSDFIEKRLFIFEIKVIKRI